jgi:PAS domain S-box-containing protein
LATKTSVLRKLMYQLARSNSLEEIYTEVFAGMRNTLAVERGAILLLDDRRSMRFVASNGLSEGYRAVVEGHSPWPSDQTDAAPVLISDVRRDPGLRSLRDVLEGERIRALAFIPLNFRHRLLGKLMLYCEEPREFTAAEIATAQVIARELATALEHRQVVGELQAQLAAERESRERAQREALLLQENGRGFRLALGAGRVGTWQWDIESGRVSWSEELEAIHGRERGSFGGDFESFLRDMHPDDKARVQRVIAQAVREPQSGYEVEYRILLPDGTQRWLAARGKVLVSHEGEPVRMTGICMDVSERKRAEETKEFLAEAGRILATTLEPETTVKNLAQMVVPRLADWCVIQVLDERGQLRPVEVVHKDPAKAEMVAAMRARWHTRGRVDTPASPSSVAKSGRASLTSRIEPEMLAAAAEDEEQLRILESLGLCSAITVPLQARGRIVGAMSLISAESKRTYGEVELHFAEEIASWAAIAIDNAQLHRQAQQSREAAERARRRLQRLTDVSDELATSLDPEAALKTLADSVVPGVADYCITYACDDGVIRRLGFAHREANAAVLAEGLNDSGTPTISDDWGVGSVIRTGRPILAEETSADSIPGGARHRGPMRAVEALGPRSSIIVPLKARGRILGAITFATTAASERRYDGEDLRLAMEMAKRTALLLDNARLYAEARAAIRARDDMIAVVSHDLRNPLQSISTSAALLKLSPTTSSRHLESISIAVAQMDRLLRDLLDISRMDAGQFTIDKRSLDPALLVDEVRKVFAPMAESKGARLAYRVAEDAPPFEGDRSRLLQVLSNLMGNALKFVAEGESITLSAERDRDHVRFAVADTGAGIESEHLAKVFDRFWQADRRSEQGAGLGLAVAKGIVEAHGGAIGVESRKGEGSVFFFLLPVGRADQETPSRDVPAA